MKTKSFFFVSFALLVSFSCSEWQQEEETPQNENGFSVTVSAPDFVFGNESKSSISTKGTFTWSAGDKIGIFSNNKESLTQSTFQLAMTLSEGEGTCFAYSSTTGWSLVPGNTFNYFSYYPYSENNSRERISFGYTGQVQTENNSTSHLGGYDYLYSDMSVASTATSASFTFHHIGCLVNVNITVPAGYENTTFYKMKVCADSDLFTSSATYSVNDVATSGSPSLDRELSNVIQLSFGDTGIKPTDGIINAWLMMCPAQWKDKTITLKLYASKNNVTTIIGTITPNANQTGGTPYAYSVTARATGQILPDKPADGEQLHIVLFGHSFGKDCMQYLPDITKAAGITNAHYGRWYQMNCSLQGHWNYFTKKEPYSYYDSNPVAGTWSLAARCVDDVLAQYPWDIIIFQQSIGFGGEGNYKSYQPELNYLTHYVDSVCTKIHGKTPVIGWNMFWGYNEGGYIDYDRGETGALKMFEAIVQAAKDMTADATKANEIPLIIPSGTALQNARGTSLNDSGSLEKPSTTQLLVRADGHHASYGIGDYVTACTWFQKIIAPIYGVGITGNTYRPYPYVLDKNYSFEGDQVTDERAAICWKCAIEAVKHPFEVTPIVEK